MPSRFHYVPLAKIASGGTATVFVGTRTRGSGRQLVALKRPHPHVLEDARQRKEVLREAHVAAAIHHPNVVGVREVESNGDEVQLVMDYVEGAALGTLIAREARADGRIPAAIALRIVLDACQGLAAVHVETDERGRLLGLVHRDVSPQNILVGVDGRARLTDFGLARATYTGAPSTTQGTLKGKLGYMAPEYVNRGEVDRTVDVFAMGVVLWEALAGLRLFRGDNEVQTLARVLHDEPGSLTVWGSELAPFDAVIARATRKEPETRLGSAAELVAALSDAMTRAGLLANEAQVGAYVRSAVGDDLAERRMRVASALSARRRPLWMGGVVLVLASLAVLGGVWARSGPRSVSAAPSVTVAPSAATAAATASATSAAENETPTPSASVAATATATAPPSMPRPRHLPRPASSSPLPPNPYDRHPR